MRVLLVDDHEAIRTVFRTALEMRPEFEIVGEASDGFDAVVAAGSLEPDVVVMDTNMPRMDGFEATQEIVQRWPDIRVLAFTSSGEDAAVAGMLQAGACGYLLKGDPIDRVIENLILTLSD